MRLLLVMIAVGGCSRGSSQPEPLLIATLSEGGVSIIRVERDDLEEVGHVDGVATAGWLDRRTLIGFQPEADSSGGTAATVRRIVDGKLADTIKLDHKDWPFPYDGSGALLFTEDGEVWVANCDTSDEHCETDYLTDHFVRVWPQPRKVRDTKPARIIKHHAMRWGEDSTWSPPTRAAPSGVKLKREKVMARDEDGRLVPVDGVACETKNARSVFPTDCCKTPPAATQT